MDNRTLSTKQQIRNLLLLIFSGIFVGLLVCLFFLYYYGPSGQYSVKNSLLSPAVLENLTFNDIDPKTGKVERFNFSGIEFSYLDASQKQMKRVQITPEQYRNFYNVIADDVSLKEISLQVEEQFSKMGSASLVLRMKTNGSSEDKIFQQLNIVTNGDYYRIELRDMTSGNKSSWIYFHHQNIYQKALQYLSS